MGISYRVGMCTPAPEGLSIEGFGKTATGGEGYPIYTVTSEAASGTGTLDSIIQAHPSNARIHFAPEVQTARTNGSRDIYENITIDGFSNGHNGIIFDFTTPMTARSIRPRPHWVGDELKSGNVIIRGMNFRGNPAESGDAINIIGTTATGSGGDSPGPFLIERCTFYQVGDGAIDITSNRTGDSVSNVTIQACFFNECSYPCLFKYGDRYNISFHHNILSKCSERPQLRGVNEPFDYVNNVEFRNLNNASFPMSWYANYGDPLPLYALRMWNSTTDTGSANGNVTINIRSNVFLGDGGRPEMLTDAGASEAGIYWDPLGSGTGLGVNYENPSLGGMSYSTDQGGTWGWIEESPRETPNDIPAEYAITISAVSELKSMIPSIGCPLRVGTDQDVLDTTAYYMP